MELYKILGICTDASEKEIKKAYRKRSLETHPDKHKGKSEEFIKLKEAEFIKVTEAHERLSDPAKRSMYDFVNRVGPKVCFTIPDESAKKQDSKPKAEEKSNFGSRSGEKANSEQNKHKTNENQYNYKQKTNENQKSKDDFSFKFVNDKAKNTFSFNPSEDIFTKQCYKWPSPKKCLGGTVVFPASSKTSKVNVSMQESNLVRQMKMHPNIKFDIYSKLLKDEDIKKLESKQLPVYCNELSEKAKSFFEDGFRKTSIDGNGNGEHYHNYDFIKSHPEEVIDMRAGHSYFMYQCAMKDAGDHS